MLNRLGMGRIWAEFLTAPFKALRFLEAKIKEAGYRSVCSIHKDAVILSYARVYNIRRERSAITIGSHSTISGELLTFAHGGVIEIGEWCYIGEGTRIWSADKVRIGHRVLIAHNVNIHDTNSHPLDPTERHLHFKNIVLKGHPGKIENIISAPVTIEDDVWIGFNSIVMKGVTIGSGSVIAAGSVVNESIPPYSLYVRDKVVRSLG